MIVGFIGFGEAASSIALGLRGEGIDRMVCYDAMQDDERMSEIMKERVAACQGEKAESAAAVCRKSDVVISAVPSTMRYPLLKTRRRELKKDSSFWMFLQRHL